MVAFFAIISLVTFSCGSGGGSGLDSGQAKDFPVVTLQINAGGGRNA